MHLLMMPVNDVMYSTTPSEDFQNIFQSVLAKKASASSDQFFIDRVTGPSCFSFCRKEEDRIMVRSAKWRVRESFVRISVCGVKVV